MSAIRRTFIAGCVAGSMVVSAFPALADGGVPRRCCGWSPAWFFGGYYPAPAYYAGPLSGATYEYYYGSYWGRPYWRHRRVHLVK
jgi:hypothetical protein